MNLILHLLFHITIIKIIYSSIDKYKKYAII